MSFARIKKALFSSNNEVKKNPQVLIQELLAENKALKTQAEYHKELSFDQSDFYIQPSPKLVKLDANLTLLEEYPIADAYQFMQPLPRFNQMVCSTIHNLQIVKFEEQVVENVNTPSMKVLWKKHLSCKRIAVHPCGNIICLDESDDVRFFSYRDLDKKDIDHQNPNLLHETRMGTAENICLLENGLLMLHFRRNERDEGDLHCMTLWDVSEKEPVQLTTMECEFEIDFDVSFFRCKIYPGGHLILYFKIAEEKWRIVHYQISSPDYMSNQSVASPKLSCSVNVSQPYYRILGDSTFYVTDRSDIGGGVLGRNGELYGYCRVPINMSNARISIGHLLADHNTYLLGKEINGTSELFMGSLLSQTAQSTGINGVFHAFLLNPHDGQFILCLENPDPAVPLVNRIKIMRYQCNYLYALAEKFAKPLIQPFLNSSHSHDKVHLNRESRDLTAIVLDYAGGQFHYPKNIFTEQKGADNNVQARSIELR